MDVTQILLYGKSAEALAGTSSSGAALSSPELIDWLTSYSRSILVYAP